MDIQLWSDEPPELVLVATVGDEEVGVLLAHRPVGAPLARLQSIVVQPAHRRQGVATSLLTALVRHLRNDGGHRIDAMYEGGPNAEVITEMLRKVGFQWPLSSMMIGVGTRRVLDGRWSRAQLSPGDRLRPWAELAPRAQATLRGADWYPDALGPFPSETVETINSIGLVVNNQIVGWCLTHRLSQDTIRYSRLFVHPAHRTGRRGVAMLVEAIRLQDAAGVRFGRFGVRTDNRGMLGFARRRLAPFLDSLKETINAELSLVEPPKLGTVDRE